MFCCNGVCAFIVCEYGQVDIDALLWDSLFTSVGLRIRRRSDDSVLF